MSRVARWSEARPVMADTCLAVALLVAFVVPSDLAAEGDVVVSLAFSTALIACLPLRRRAPVTVFAVVSVLCLVQLALLDTIVAGDVVALIALYTVVAYGAPAWVAAAATACAVVGAGLAATRWDPSAENVSWVETVSSTVVSVLLAAALGAWQRSRRAQLEALRQRNRLLAIERDQQAAVGAALERSRIARELHDVIAHSLAVMVAQADGAAAGAQRRPADAVAALRTIGDTGREALGQMRRLLGVLRDEAGPPGARAPQPGVSELDGLVAQVVRAGVPARLAVSGAQRTLPRTVDVALYRLAQEALTNVVKHGRNVSRVDVNLRYGEDRVELLVRDDGEDAPAPDGGGHGVVGMRERLALHDGTLTVGPQDGGGFAVRATIPTERSAA